MCAVCSGQCVCTVCVQCGAVCVRQCVWGSVCVQCVWGSVCVCVCVRAQCVGLSVHAVCGVWGPAGGLRKRSLFLGYPPVSPDHGLCPSGAFSSGGPWLVHRGPTSCLHPSPPKSLGTHHLTLRPFSHPPSLAQAPNPLPASGLLLLPSSSTAPWETPPLGTSSDVTSSVRPSWVSHRQRAGPSCRAFPTHLIKSQPWVWSHRLLAAGEEANMTAFQVLGGGSVGRRV